MSEWTDGVHSKNHAAWTYGLWTIWLHRDVHTHEWRARWHSDSAVKPRQEGVAELGTQDLDVAKSMVVAMLQTGGIPPLEKVTAEPWFNMLNEMLEDELERQVRAREKSS